MDEILNQKILEMSRLAFILTDKNLSINELGGHLEIIDANTNWLHCSLPDIFPELVGYEAELADILAGKKNGIKLEFVNRETAGGQTRFFSMEDQPYRDEAGVIRGIIHLVQDVTNSAMLEQQITQNRNELQLLQENVARQNLELVAANTEVNRLSELKSQFVSMTAHELRTPLTSIMGYVEMLLDGQAGSLADAQREYLGIVQKSGSRLLNLTDELLVATRLEAGQMDLVLEPVDLEALVKAVMSEYMQQIISKKQSLETEFLQGLPPALCDVTRTNQIVTNLLSNAIKFTPDGGHIIIRTGLSEQPGYLQLSVADTGIGISNRDKDLIFSRWFRTKIAAFLKVEGFGLGLYITRLLVELHNGSIWVESQPGHGSVFHVTFPIAE